MLEKVERHREMNALQAMYGSDVVRSVKDTAKQRREQQDIYQRLKEADHLMADAMLQL